MHSPLLKQIDALLVTTHSNIRYLTGFVGASPTAREAYVLVTKKKLYLFTNSLYLEQVKKRQGAIKYQIVEISKEKPLSTEIQKILQKLKATRLGFEQNNITVLEFKNLKKKLSQLKLVPTTNRVESLRQIKSKTEIENIKKACALGDKCYDYILTQLKPEVTETEIAWQIEKFFKEHGANLAFSPIVAFGKNSSMPHYQPSSDQKLKTIDMVLLDFGCRINGYCSDMTRAVFVGKPSLKHKKVYESVLSAQKLVIKNLYDSYAEHVAKCDPRSTITKNLQFSSSGAKLDKIARKSITDDGFTPYSHSLGHAVGLDIHELPRLTIKKDAELKPGMVFSVEPAIYVEGKFGIRIEDLILLKDHSFEILTKSPRTQF